MYTSDSLHLAFHIVQLLEIQKQSVQDWSD